MVACYCGQPVALRAGRISVNRRRGITHWIEHRDGSKVCRQGDWTSAALKPYPKVEADMPWKQLVARWNALDPGAR